MSTVVTPVDFKALEDLLIETKYDLRKTKYLVDSFEHGFDIGYEGDENVQIRAPNMRLTIGSEIELWNKVMSEVKEGRYAGPFESIPFEHYIQSPLGLVPKDNGKKTRLIFHLSYPRGKKKISLNANTPPERCSVKYPDFSHAVLRCLEEGKFCHLSKSDMKSAFHVLGIRIKDFKYLVMMAKSPIDGKVYFFIDKCFPFGASISCAHFQAVSDAIAHIVQFKTVKILINYLDDFLFIAFLQDECNRQLIVFLDVCSTINFPVAMEKTFWASTKLTFLGMLLDAERGIVCLPLEKIQRATETIQTILNKGSKKITLLELQKICGLLNFFCRCIVPGRAFTRRLYLHTAGVLKPHHHIRITQDMHLDLSTWLTFLKHPSIFCREFADFSGYATANQISFYTDAVKNEILGFGGICGTSWMMKQWDSQFIREKDPSIEYLELYAVTAGVLAWIHRFKNSQIVLFCDNQSAVPMINNMSSNCKNCMVLIRMIILQGLIHNTHIYAQHVKGSSNTLSDLLSRQKLHRFRELTGNQFEQIGTTISEKIYCKDLA